jgi:hypothetical protein
MADQAFATGKFALGICDRCGFQYPLSQLRKEWNGLKVCVEECYEEKHPQLFPIHITTDPEALRDPRPARVEPQEIFVGGPGATAQFFKQARKPLNIKATLGTVTVTIS